MKIFDIRTVNECIPIEQTPDYIIETDFETIGIVVGKRNNAAMKAAIDAVTNLTNCLVLSIKSF